jgi:hypothetical protein
MVMHHVVDTDAEHDTGHHPHTVRRSCTDIPCCIIFSIALAAFGFVMWYGFKHGDPYRFLHLQNSRHEQCGAHENVKDSPFLYFCNVSGQFHLNNTLCVPECPGPDQNAVPGCSALATPYGTRPLAGLLCIPDSGTAARELERHLKSPSLKRAIQVQEVLRAWKVLAIVAGVALILGFVFCCLMESCAFCIFWGSVFVLILTLGSAGGYLLYETRLVRDERLPEVTTGDPQKDFIIGCVLSGAAFLLLCISCCLCSIVNTALESFKQAADCITDIPSLLLQPFIDVAIRTILFLFLATGLWFLVSTAEMGKEAKLGSYQIDYDKKEYAFMAFYVFMFYWIMEAAHALSNFVMSYAVQLWFHYTNAGNESSSQAPCFPTFQGLLAGLTFHLGTFAMGSFIIACVRVLRDLMALITKQANESGNAVLTCCACCCTCCLDCFNRFLRFMTKSAYMDTAMNSNSFFPAAYHAATVLLEYAGSVITLNTATFIFQAAGLCGIAAGGVGACHLLCTYWPEFSDPEGEAYVENKLQLYAVAGIISAFVASPFMTLLDQVSDTLLYCNAIEKKRTPPEPELEEEFEKPTGGLCCCCTNPTPRSNNSNHTEKDSLVPGRYG